MTIVEEVIDFVEQKAAKAALDWAEDRKIFDNHYPSTDKILRLEEELYNAYISQLKRWLNGNDSD